MKISEKHFEKHSEAEVVIVICVFLMVIAALPGTNVCISLQPSVTGHSVFTFILMDQETEVPLTFIEVLQDDQSGYSV